MEERQNTLVSTRWFKHDRDCLCVNLAKSVPVIFEPPCTFDLQSPRISAYEIRERIQELHVPEAEVTTIQMDGPRRKVFMKFVDLQYVLEVLQKTRGQAEYKLSNGEISSVRIEMAALGTKLVRIANLPLGTDEGTIRAALAQYVITLT